jgi:hypothetical protein
VRLLYARHASTVSSLTADTSSLPINTLLRCAVQGGESASKSEIESARKGVSGSATLHALLLLLLVLLWLPLEAVAVPVLALMLLQHTGLAAAVAAVGERLPLSQCLWRRS